MIHSRQVSLVTEVNSWTPLHTCSVIQTFFSRRAGFIRDSEIKERLRSFGPKCFEGPMMIKLSNAIPRDMTTDSGDCWLLLGLGVSVPSSMGRAGGLEERT